MINSVHTYVSRKQHRNGSGGEAWAARPAVGLGVNTGQTHMGLAWGEMVLHCFGLLVEESLNWGHPWSLARCMLCYAVCVKPLTFLFLAKRSAVCWSDAGDLYLHVD